MIPQYLEPLFWDVNPANFEPQSYPEYTIARVLEYGDTAAVAWLKAHFSEETIRAVICAELRLSRKSASFWSLIYQIPPAEVAALK